MDDKMLKKGYDKARKGYGKNKAKGNAMEAPEKKGKKRPPFKG
jgi:hypothetical protein